MCGTVASPTPMRPIEIRFDQADTEFPSEHVSERRGGHPAGRAAADDDDVADGCENHQSRLTQKIKARNAGFVVTLRFRIKDRQFSVNRISRTLTESQTDRELQGTRHEVRSFPLTL